MFYDSVAHLRRQKIDNRPVNFGRRGKRPAFLSIGGNNFRNLIGELFMNATVHFCCQSRPFSNGARATMSTRAVSHRKTSSQVAQYSHPPTVCVGTVECLH